MRKFLIVFFLIPFLFLAGCQKQSAPSPERKSVYYQVFVGSFYDSDQDGIGDLQGVIEKLDYLQNDLGISGIWLSPIHPSPTYHKYDVVDYLEIDPEFGSMEDFIELSDAMNERGMDLMIDFVFNHTSSQHPWFLEAKDAVLNDSCIESEYCDYYNFSEEFDAGYTQLSNGTFYESQFWSEMPDLNLDNPKVRQEISDIAQFWIDKGVDGFRLDATTHFYENKISKNTEILNWFMSEVQSMKEDIYVVGEAWTNKSIIFDMYESGIDSFFNFSFSQNDGSIVKSINRENGLALAQSVYDYNQDMKSHNPEAIDALFLSNHDNGRSAAYFANQIEKQKMAASLYLLMPGNSFVYYGEEIGMLGSGIDENKRLPMRWGEKESKYVPLPYDAVDYHDFDIDSVEEQLKDKESLLAHYQKAIQIKNHYPELVEGTLEVLDLNHKEIYAMKHDQLIVLHNLSEKTIEVELEGDLIESLNSKIKQKGKTLEMSPYSSFIIKEIND